MKTNRVSHSGSTRRTVLAIVSFVVLVGGATAVFLGYHRLRALTLEQSVLEDVDAQVSVVGANMVRPGIILDELGLVKGANLAEMDFPKCRETLLRRIPNIRAVTITRKQPNGLRIAVEERKPLVRMNVPGGKSSTGRVADVDGVVFYCSKNTQNLPVVRENAAAVTRPGGRLTPRGLAAVRLVDLCRDGDFQSLGLLEVDITKSDYLFATLSNYSRAKIAWEGMDDPPSEKQHDNLVYQIEHLIKAIGSNVLQGAVIWNATDTSRPCCIYADKSQSVL